jgi:hypothetical protein
MFDQSKEPFSCNSHFAGSLHVKNTSYFDKYVGFEMNAYVIHLLNRMFDIFVEFGLFVV